jgi:subtilisin family serine protease
MRLVKHSYLLIIISSLLFVPACKKDKDQSGQGPETEEECPVNPGMSGKAVEGQYIITYSPAAQAGSAGSGKLATLSSTILESNAIRSSGVVQSFGGDMGGFVAKISAEEAERLRMDQRISIVEQDRVVALGGCFILVEPRLLTWSAKRIGYGDGTGKTAWIIDTGIDFDHPDLNVDTTRSRSFISGLSSADDQNGHGTHVAGIIGAKNNNFGMLGIASGANLVSLRVLKADGEGLASSIIQALAYVSTNAKAGDVVNMSVGEEQVSATLDQQVKNLAAKGIFVCIAAGNENKPAIDFSPGRANAPNIYTVSAVDSLDNFASFSNYGNDAVDVAAPGVRIISCYLNGKYAIMSGTSMAAPHVAGLLLLKGNAITTSGTAKNDPDGVADPIAHY